MILYSPANSVAIGIFGLNIKWYGIIMALSILIGFCFSYPMTITEDGDGILINFSKEIKAPEVVGCHIGQELKKALAAHGWKNKLTVSLLNDTVAALLAGAAVPCEGMKFSSYIGFILGTGNCGFL